MIGQDVPARSVLGFCEGLAEGAGALGEGVELGGGVVVGGGAGEQVEVRGG